MSATLLCLLAAPALALPLEAGKAVELRYSGTLTYAGREKADAADKRFTLYGLLTGREAGGHQLAFLLDEEGGGGWAWPERFGTIDFDRTNSATGRQPIQLLHTHDETPYPVALRLPLFEHSEKLKEGASWDADKLSYEVVGRAKVGDRECWQVTVASRFGRAQTLWIDATSPLVVKAEHRVFLGQGDRFTLEMQLESSRQVEREQLPRLNRVVETLAELKQNLGRDENEKKPELSDEQLKSAAAAVEPLTKAAEATPFSRYVAAVSRDVGEQLRRSGDVAELAKKHVGQPAPGFELKSLDGSPVDSKEHRGKVVLLHFWDYRGDPLMEPYGQVGYLDFLNSRRRKLGVQVYGVAVDPRLSDDGQAAAALQSIRKLKAFMNLSYPVTRDDGALLAKFGDPRRFGAKLPLWVVIGADGKVRHYKAGFYEIKPDEGLRALDDELVRLIREQRGSGNDE